MKADKPLELAYPISDLEFSLFQGLIQRHSGIFLSEAKKPMLVLRLARRLRALGMDSFRDYYDLVSGSDESERIAMLDCVCTNETRFFREPEQLEYFERRTFPFWKQEAESGKRPRRISVWSAGCSTGEEPYSIATMLFRNFPGWKLQVVATDISTTALARASAAVWPADRLLQVPRQYAKSFVRVPGKDRAMTIDPPVRSMVRFQRLNLMDQGYLLPFVFDAIFCRNVLIYFDAATRQEVVGRLLERLAPSGYLMLGQAECLSSHRDKLAPVAPSAYLHRAAQTVSLLRSHGRATGSANC
ncbi:MAG TPA: protein-glutamate O-methyltransferase CheR [Blastocatellia bacterium]|nr:protein-glutamate O-methyltransferase CheR [Blastocatellia bacterium]